MAFDVRDPRNVFVDATLLYAHLYEKQVSKNFPDAKPMYRVTLPIPKTDTRTVQAIVNAEAATFDDFREKQVGWSKIDFNHFPTESRALKDGDATDNEQLAGCWKISASSESKPNCYDIDGTELNLMTDPDRLGLYSGAKARVALRFGASHGKICAFIQAVRKIADGERLGGTNVTYEDFGLANTPEPQPQLVGQAAPQAPAAPPTLKGSESIPPNPFRG
jgi:hypothetical protein